MSAEGTGGVATAIPWIVAIVGWGFTHIFSEARERRKEVRAQLDKTIEQLLALEKAAREFHMAPEFAPIKAHDLTALIHTFERKLHRISCLNIDDLVGRIVRLRRAITLSNFDKSDFKAQTAESDVLGGIADAAADMEDAMESHYRARYPSTFPYFRWRKS